MQRPITPELIRAALAHIPANLPRDEWARVGMAIKSEYPDDTGLQLFADWSATAEGYDAGGTRSTWRSIKAGGGVRIGTLLHLAKEHGFTMPKADQAAPAPSAAEPARRRRERDERAAAERAAEAEAHRLAADEAAGLWDAAGASDAAGSACAYLARKGVQLHGARVDPDGWLLVPLRDADGKLWNVQRIAPEKPAQGPDKLFLKGGRKSGLWHLIGSPAGASVVLIAEGYATAASVHEATGWPVAVAFDAGNLAHVARALHRQLPTVPLLLCGDDDAATQARTGRNPGREKAEAAARAVHGLAVFPRDLPEGGSDFNDLHQARGLDAVRDQMEAAVARLLAQPMQTDAREQAQGALDSAVAAFDDAEQGAVLPQPQESRQRAIRAARSGAAADGGAGDPFALDEGGVYYLEYDREGGKHRRVWIATPLEVTAIANEPGGAGFGYLLEFPDRRGVRRRWVMPAAMRAGDGAECRRMLLHLGVDFDDSSRARSLLMRYIRTRQPGNQAIYTERTGWFLQGGRAAYVLPHETIGESDEPVLFQSDSPLENAYAVRGDVGAWRAGIGAACAGNTRLVFAVCCGLAAPLLRLAGMESGGFHLRGDSTDGKTTALRVAASVFGTPDLMQRWRATDNAMEGMAAQRNDGLLLLDELSQVDGKAAGEIAYMLANGQGKVRSTKSAAPRPVLKWTVLWLSTGEVRLADRMAEGGGARTRTGQELRMVDIPANPGAGLGVFDTIHGEDTAADFAALVAKQAADCHGAVGRAFLERATHNPVELGDRVSCKTAALSKEWLPPGASGQVARVARRFALVAVAGELATKAGMTGWPDGEATRAARACFDAWLGERGGVGNGEEMEALRQVRRFIEANGEARFSPWERAGDAHAPKTMARAGFRRGLGSDGKPLANPVDGWRPPSEPAKPHAYEYYVLPEAFRAEICAGLDYRAVARTLKARGCLLVDMDDDGRLTRKVRLPGMGPVNCYCITAKIMQVDPSATGAAADAA